MLCKEAVKEFKDLYKKECGVELSDAEARDKANNIVTFFKVIINEISRYEKISSSSTKGGVLNDNKDKSN